MSRELSRELLTFLHKSPSSFHAVYNLGQMLKEDGYVELFEKDVWDIKPEGKYFVKRNDTSIIAFHIGKDLSEYSFNIAASHSDFPTFKIKEKAGLDVKGKYIQLNTEGYGGMLCSTWFDRPLSVAGRVMVKVGDHLEIRLLNVDRDLIMIPSLAIHMNRQVNDGYAYNKQVDMLPLFGADGVSKEDFDQLIADELGVSKDDIYGKDLYLYNRQEGTIWGAREEFISSPHLDDMQCAFATLKGFLKGYHEKSVNVYACFDNEEVGSVTKQGAGSTFLYDVLRRINSGLGKTEEDYYRAVSESFMVSADNAHAVHPNHPQKTDVENCVYMNEGIVIKSHAGQKYTSDAVSIAIFRNICKQAGVPVQFFANRSDEAGGSTLGNISSAQVSLNAVDIGLPQLAMHSAYETAGIKDTEYMVQAMKTFFESHICMENGQIIWT